MSSPEQVISELYEASLAIWDHTLLLATRHKWTRPAYTAARQVGTRLTNPGGMAGWVDFIGWVHTETVYVLDKQPSK